MSSEWQHYFLCLGFHLGVPLFPLGTEWLVTRGISSTSAYLVASTYALSIGTSSRNPLSLGLMYLGGFAAALMFGLSASAAGRDAGHLALLTASWPPIVGIALVFIAHALERYNRHVADLEPFWEFIKERRG